jgi:2TM domain
MHHETHPLSPEQIERIAVRRVKAKMGWFFHAAIYAFVNLFLMAGALFHGKHWNLFPLIGWGFGLSLHGAIVWFNSSITCAQWRERMLEKERAALAKNAPSNQP